MEIRITLHLTVPTEFQRADMQSFWDDLFRSVRADTISANTAGRSIGCRAATVKEGGASPTEHARSMMVAAL